MSLFLIFVKSFMKPAKKKKKNYFTKPYIKYKEQPELVKEVKSKYKEMLMDPMISDFNILSILSETYRIPRPTLVSWKKRWAKDPDWLPGSYLLLRQMKRIFPDEVENSISNFIIDNYIKPGNYLPDWQFKNIMFQAYNENDSIKRDFHCSPHFIIDFKNRHRFSSRLAHIKRRPDPEPVEDNLTSIDKFLIQVNQTIESARASGEPGHPST